MRSRGEPALDAWIAGGSGAPVAARQLVTSELSELLEQDTLYDLLLLTTELVTNAVVHAGVDETRMLELQVAWDGPLLHVSVFDPGGESDPHVKQPDLDVPGGVGLFLVEQLSSRWGVERGRDGSTQVWFDLSAIREPVAELAGHRIELTPVVHSAPRAVAIVTSSSALN
jgi:sigma-B regulation protein RsbU (phosphoserine phosphatase)